MATQPGGATADNMDTYLDNFFSYMDDNLYDWIDADANLNDQTASNYNTLLGVIDDAKKAFRNTQITALIGNKRRTMTSSQQDHVFQGEVEMSGGEPSKVTGYHWTGDEEAANAMITPNTKGQVGTKFGIYQAGVQSVATKKKGEQLAKNGGNTASTF